MLNISLIFFKNIIQATRDVLERELKIKTVMSEFSISTAAKGTAWQSAS